MQVTSASIEDRRHEIFKFYNTYVHSCTFLWPELPAGTPTPQEVCCSENFTPSEIESENIISEINCYHALTPEAAIHRCPLAKTLAWES